MSDATPDFSRESVDVRKHYMHTCQIIPSFSGNHTAAPHLTMSRPSSRAEVLLWMTVRAAWIGVNTRNHIVIRNCAGRKPQK